MRRGAAADLGDGLRRRRRRAQRQGVRRHVCGDGIVGHDEHLAQHLRALQRHRGEDLLTKVAGTVTQDVGAALGVEVGDQFSGARNRL